MSQVEKEQKEQVNASAEESPETLDEGAKVGETLSEEEEQALAFADLERERDDWREKAYRAAAELDNSRKRFHKERQELRNFGVEPLVSELLPVADNLERAIAHAGEDSTVAEGVRMVLKQFMQVLAAKGAVPFDAKGEKFDPALHEAMSQMPAADVEPGTVIEVFQKGWMLNQRLVRPAMVVVACEPEPQADENSPVSSESQG